MSENRGKKGWLETIHIFADILGKILIPIVLVLISSQWSRHQASMLEKQKQSDLDLKCLDMVYNDLKSESDTQRTFGLTVLTQINKPIADKLLNIITTFKPKQATVIFDQIASDPNQHTDIRSKAKRLGFEQLDNFKILKPINGEHVGLNTTIKGRSKYIGLNHYAVVTTEEGDNHVQPTINLDKNGNFTSTISLGSAGAGKNKDYIVKIIATMDSLKVGPLDKYPDDYFSSNSINLIRTN